MALDFPSSPVDGQIYEGFFWDDTLGVWKKSTAPVFLDSIDDVNITTPADNEVLAYDTTSGEWINQTASEANLALASHTHPYAPELLLETSQQTTNYVVNKNHKNMVVLMNGTNLTVTVPSHITAPMDIGIVVNIYNANSTDVTITGASGVTVRNAGALAQYGEVSLRKRGTNEWVLAGNVS